ncbi:MAG: hypothetical protein U0838_15940 [Chloroflexota bacterium]
MVAPGPFPVSAALAARWGSLRAERGDAFLVGLGRRLFEGAGTVHPVSVVPAAVVASLVMAELELAGSLDYAASSRSTRRRPSPPAHLVVSRGGPWASARRQQATLYA